MGTIDMDEDTRLKIRLALALTWKAPLSLPPTDEETEFWLASINTLDEVLSPYKDREFCEAMERGYESYQEDVRTGRKPPKAELVGYSPGRAAVWSKWVSLVLLCDRLGFDVEEYL